MNTDIEFAIRWTRGALEAIRALTTTTNDMTEVRHLAKTAGDYLISASISENTLLKDINFSLIEGWSKSTHDPYTWWKGNIWVTQNNSRVIIHGGLHGTPSKEGITWGELQAIVRAFWNGH